MLEPPPRVLQRGCEMMSFSIHDGPAAQHRRQLLREAEQARLAQEAVTGVTGAVDSASRAVSDAGQQLMRWARHPQADASVLPGSSAMMRG